MPDKDRPPEHIWLNDKALNEHFEDVKQRSNESSGTTTVVPDMESNELTKGLKG